MVNCLICREEISPFISFGRMPIANGFLAPEQFDLEYFFELKVAYCPKCNMVQLTEFVDREKMFHENYAFFSSTSAGMTRHFSGFAEWVKQSYLSEEPFVVEIGSNDGIMLQNFAKDNINHLGVEPSKNVASVAIEKGINTVSCFFDLENAEKIKAQYGKADVIMGANVMCHIPYIHSVFDGVESLLKEDGVLIFEDPYLGDIVEKTSYDQIYDEHAFYFCAKSVSNLCDMHGLELIDALPQEVHGGSMRYVIGHKGRRKVSEAVKSIIQKENQMGLGKKATYEKLAEQIANSREDFLALLTKLKEDGKTVVGYGATSKSTTVLNYCNIGPDLIKYICDTTPIKQGKYSPGMHIPIVPYDLFKTEKPEYTVLFAWNHSKEIFEKENDYIENNGNFILYVPKVYIK